MKGMRFKAQKKIASKINSTAVGRNAVAKVLGDEGDAVVTFFKHAAAKVDDKKVAKEMKSDLLKIITKVGMLVQNKLITLEDAKSIEGPIIAVCNSFIDSLEMVPGGVDHSTISTQMMDAHATIYPMIKPHMKDKNSAKVTKLFTYFSSQKFLGKFLNHPECAEEREGILGALSIMVRPYQIEDSEVVVEARRRKQQKMMDMRADPNLKDWLEDDGALQYLNEFLVSEGKAQYLQFWLAVESYKQISARGLLESRAPKLFEKYLGPQAAASLPVDAAILAAIDEELWDVIRRTIFNKAQSRIRELIDETFQADFPSSEPYKKWIIANDGEAAKVKKQRRSSLPNTTARLVNLSVAIDVEALAAEEGNVESASDDEGAQ
jgi:hypothetical protein